MEPMSTQPSDRLRRSPPLPSPSVVVEIGPAVVVGAALRSIRRSDVPPDIVRDIHSSLLRSAANGDPACAIVARWMERRLPGRIDPG